MLIGQSAPVDSHGARILMIEKKYIRSRVAWISTNLRIAIFNQRRASAFTNAAAA